MSHPGTNIGTARTVRARARGTGHRRRLSQVRVSRASMYETIEEEPTTLSYSPASAQAGSPSPATQNPQTDVKQDPVFIVDADSISYQEHWNDETGMMTIRRYHALCDEAEEIVTESKRVWEDTPFSVFALQCKISILYCT
jgi:serine/arginine repetitive matrix protein 2